MSRATPQLRTFAKRLMTHEMRANRFSKTKDPAVFPVFEKLRPQLVTLMGAAGFRALVARSIAVASEEVRWLRAVHVKSDGSLTELRELQAQLTPAQLLEGKTVLLAQLLGLLVAFIGESLTVQLTREVWPNLSPSAWDFGKGDPIEKA